MANPLRELELSARGFQLIQEVAIEATPEKVWASLLNVQGWFFGNEAGTTHVLELKPGGRWYTERADGSVALHGLVTLVEPGKLLRLSGAMGLTHLPVSSVTIFELQPKNEGKATLLRTGQRTYGFMDADVEKRYSGGWKEITGKIKVLAEG